MHTGFVTMSVDDYEREFQFYRDNSIRIIPKRFLCPYCGQWHRWRRDLVVKDWWIQEDKPYTIKKCLRPFPAFNNPDGGGVFIYRGMKNTWYNPSVNFGNYSFYFTRDKHGVGYCYYHLKLLTPKGVHQKLERIDINSIANKYGTPIIMFQEKIEAENGNEAKEVSVGLEFSEADFRRILAIGTAL